MPLGAPRSRDELLGFARELTGILVEQGAKLSAQLMTLNLEKASNVVPVSICAQVDGMRPFLGRLLNNQLQLDVELAEGLPLVPVDPVHDECPAPPVRAQVILDV